MAISLLSDYCKCLKNEFLCPIFSLKCIKFNKLFIFGFAVRIGHWKLWPSKNWQNFGLGKGFLVACPAFIAIYWDFFKNFLFS